MRIVFYVDTAHLLVQNFVLKSFRGMSMKRIMALDIGDKTIGMAVSDPLGITAQGVGTIRRTKLMKDLDVLDGYVKQYDVDRFVIGLPKNMNNTIGPQGNKVKQVAGFIRDRYELPIYFQDERLSTKAAEYMMSQSSMNPQKKKGIVDEVAAQIILQRYLDQQK